MFVLGITKPFRLEGISGGLQPKFLLKSALCAEFKPHCLGFCPILETSRNAVHTTSLGCPVLRTNYPLGENCFPYTWWEHLLCQLKPVLPPSTSVKSSGLSSQWPLGQVAAMLSPKLSIFWAQCAHFPQLFLTGEVFLSPIIVVALHWIHSRSSMGVLYRRSQNWWSICMGFVSPFTQYSLTFLHPLPVILLIQVVVGLLCFQVTDTCFCLPGRKWPGRAESSEPKCYSV